MSVLGALVALGIEGKVVGEEFIAPCPMHAERTGRADAHPSWSINTVTGLHICFSCDYRGSLARLVEDLGGDPSLSDARQDLQQAVQRIPGPYIPARRADSVPEHRLAAFCDPPRWAIRRRGLDAASCARFEIRWLIEADAWIIPIRNPLGALLGWQRKGELCRTFRNHPLGVRKSHSLFGYAQFQGGRMVVVESPLDAVRLHTLGMTGAVATYGATVSDHQLMMMTAADEVVFALDNDQAGRSNSSRLLVETKGLLRSVKFFSYGDSTAKDPGEMSVWEIERGLSLARSRAHGDRALA